MNPFLAALAYFHTPPTDVEMSGLVAVLQLRAEAYTSGFTQGPANGPLDYVLRDLRSKFGDTPLVVRFAQMFSSYLGK